MFTWICPQCGREVPPSYTECPDCAERAAKGEAPAPGGEAAPPPPPRQPEQPAAPQAVLPASMPMSPQVPRKHTGLPAWLMTLAFAFAFVGLGACIYWGVNYYRGRQGTGPAPVTTLETPSKGAKPHPLQKYLEVAGMRFVSDKKNKTDAKFLVINHSDAEITDLAGTMTIWGRTQRSEEDAVGTVAFKIGDIGPNQSREVTAPVNTKLRIYELPDWQNVSTDLQITSPPAQ